MSESSGYYYLEVGPPSTWYAAVQRRAMQMLGDGSLVTFPENDADDDAAVDEDNYWNVEQGRVRQWQLERQGDEGA